MARARTTSLPAVVEVWYQVDEREKPGCDGVAARLPNDPGVQKLSPVSSAEAKCGTKASAIATVAPVRQCEGGNATGITTLAAELAAKRLSLLRELVPQAASMAALIKPSHPSAKPVTQSLQATARTLGVQLNVLEASSDHEIEAASAALKPRAALLVATDPFFFVRRAQLVALSARHAVPTIYDSREFGSRGPGGLIGLEQRQLVEDERLCWTVSQGGKGTEQRDGQRRCSKWSSISRPPSRLASRCHRPCWRWPTK